MNLPVIPETKRLYFELYREWLDESQPNHHIHTKRRKQNEYLEVCVRRLNGQINYRKSFRIDPGQPLTVTLNKTRRFRDTIPTKVILMRASGEVELPTINEDKRCGSWRVGTSEYHRFTAQFPYPYDSAVKCLFDTLGVEYPDNLFKYTCDAPVRKIA